jgi:quinol monooxygenase YgiN
MAYLEITLTVAPEKRAAAAAVYRKFRQPFLSEVRGAADKQLLVRDDDVQVLHRFDTAENAAAYLETPMFSADVVGELGPLLAAPPEVRIYDQV